MVRLRAWRRYIVFSAAMFAWASEASASPAVPIDDSVYPDLFQLREQGRIPALSLSALRPLTELQIQALLHQGEPQPSASLEPYGDGFWAQPARQLAFRFTAASLTQRPYSVAARPRSMEGGVDLSCEHQEGRPCGNGATGMLEFDSAAGYGKWLTAYSRFRAQSHGVAQSNAQFVADRLYLSLELGPAVMLVGRNPIVIGPGRHTQLVWGDNPPPLDQVSFSVLSLKLPDVPLKVGGSYILGSLDSPQRFPHSLVSIARVYVEVADRLHMAMTNLMELGGKGAPSVGFWQFFEEHVKRTGPWPGEGVSNRRLGFDWTLALPELNSTLYSEFVFEDWRAQFASTLAYDVDYLLGWSTSSLGRGGRQGFVLEFVRTGVRSQEHGEFSSGMTSGGRVLGAPIGPDAVSLYASPTFDRIAGTLSISPWTEVARIGSDVYDFPETAAISRIRSGVPEYRLRGGVTVRSRVAKEMSLRADTFAEHVQHEAFLLHNGNNGGVLLSLIWRPQAEDLIH